MQYKKIKKIVVKNPRQVWKVFNEIIKMEDKQDRRKEHLWGMGLNTSNRIEYVELISLGTLNQTLIHPREVFRLAVLKNTNGLIIAHNHPSNRTQPSEEDIEMTKRLAVAGQYVGIPLLDHLILSDKTFSSMSHKMPRLFNLNADKITKNASKILGL